MRTAVCAGARGAGVLACVCVRWFFGQVAQENHGQSMVSRKVARLQKPRFELGQST